MLIKFYSCSCKYFISYIYVLSVLLVAGCASSPKNFKSIPVTKEEFKLSGNELVNKYSDITEYSNKNAGNINSPLYAELEGKWGKPVTTEIIKPELKNQTLYLLGLGYAAFPNDLFLALTLPAINYYINNNSQIQKRRVWEKGDYRIDAQFYENKVTNQEHLISWEWYQENVDENISTRKSLTTMEKNDYYFQIIFSHGGDAIGMAENGDKLYASDRTTLQIGKNFRIPGIESKLKASLGIKYTGFLVPRSDVVFDSMIVETLVPSKLSKRSSINYGLGYWYDNQMSGRNIYGQNVSIKYDPALVAIIEYSVLDKRWGRIGARVELCDLTDKSNNKINADSFGVFSHYSF